MNDPDADLPGRHGNALEHARLAVERGPGDACNWQHLGLTLLRMRQYLLARRGDFAGGGTVGVAEDEDGEFPDLG